MLVHLEFKTSNMTCIILRILFRNQTIISDYFKLPNFVLVQLCNISQVYSVFSVKALINTLPSPAHWVHLVKSSTSLNVFLTQTLASSMRPVCHVEGLTVFRTLWYMLDIQRCLGCDLFPPRLYTHTPQSTARNPIVYQMRLIAVNTPKSYVR